MYMNQKNILKKEKDHKPSFVDDSMHSADANPYIGKVDPIERLGVEKHSLIDF